MNSPLDHQREPRACPASLNSLGGDTAGEKAKCKLNYKNLFFHLVCLLPSLVGTGDSSLKVALTIAYAHTMFVQLTSCYTTGVFLKSELQESAFRIVVPS